MPMRSDDDASVPGDQSEPIDLVHLGVQTGGEPSLQRDLLDLFIVQSAEFVARIDSLIKVDSTAAADLVHKLKGSARAIGAFELAGAATVLENDIAVGDGNAALEPMFAALERALGAAESCLRGLPPRRST
jgi:HPt (histidine-containing phosphotransfer) domain-containing protein